MCADFMRARVPRAKSSTAAVVASAVNTMKSSRRCCPMPNTAP